ncbi:1-acyl-sn-glycerol-3-phosphate acyltransferase [Oleiphilus messinensis]|uniref:1-acyl-sn-glycerol-3-phosphate acyltransferase n=1 Tax=Oleiphilus messinensis TaxID=141451 RepID=A0A1Y0IFR6_9GAMM|nr:lysophospholipid acyltransferase family protein [Oleiphilus messinensis]ARU58656.1 1-acyl-sn-glycerol-3-phosphate acyltransferase [Oleiphilus messinensis]
MAFEGNGTIAAPLPPSFLEKTEAAGTAQEKSKLKTLRTYYRLTRLSNHCGKAAILLPGYFTYQKLRGKQADNLHLLEVETFARWMSRFTRLLNVEVQIHGEKMAGNGFFVANHISWLDAVVLAQLHRFSFVAKDEVKEWPLVGQMSQKMNTVFIKRTSKFSVYRSLPRLEEALQNGASILAFPEGTTSVGKQILPFFPMLFETATRTQKPVQPVLLRYTDEAGNLLPEVGFVDGDTVFDTLFRMLEKKRIVAHIHLLPELAPADCRKQLARDSREALSKYLETSQTP